MRVSLLGPLRVTDDEGAEIRWSGRKQRRLLAVLACEANHVVPVDRIAEAVWEGRPPAAYVGTLQVHLTMLRKALEPSRAPSSPSRVRAGPGGYELVAGPDDLDTLRFDAAVTAGSAALATGRPAEAAELLSSAVAMWRGPVLADLSDDAFVATFAAAWDERRLHAEETLAQAQLALGRGRDVATRLQALLVEHPLRERLWEQLMVALYQEGRQADALATYDRARRVLDEELGIEPGPSLRQCQVRVLQQDRSLTPLPPRVRLGALPRPLSTVVGRTSEIARVLDALSGDDHRLVMVTGPGGIGKTRVALAAAQAWWEGSDAGTAAHVTIAVDDTDLLTPIARALKLPSDATQPSTLAAAVGPQDVLVLDDELAIQDLPRLAQTITLAPRLRALLTTRTRTSVPGALVVALGPLGTAGEASAAVQMFLDRADAISPVAGLTPADRDAIPEIVHRLDGVPLAIELAASRTATLRPVELLRRLTVSLDVARHEPARADRHSSIRAAIDWSLNLLDGASRDLLVLASTFRSPFGADDLEGVAAATGYAGDVLRGLESLVRASLVDPVESPVGRRFRLLTVVRETVRPDGAERRALLADAHLEYQYRRAAAADRDTAELIAVEADLRAAYRHAMQQRAAGPAADVGLALIAVLRGQNRHADVRHLCDEILAALPPAGQAAAVQVMRAGSQYMLGAYDEARSDLAALAEVPRDRAEIRVRGLCWLALLEAQAGQTAGADAAVAHAIEVASASGHDDLVSLVLSAAGFLSRESGRPQLAVEYAERRFELSHDPVDRAWIQLGLAQAQVDLQDPAAAQSAELAVVAGTRLGVRAVVLEATACLAYAALSAGQLDAAGEFGADLLRRLDRDDPGFQVAEAISIAALVWAARGDRQRCVDLMALGDAELRDHGEIGTAHLALFDPQIRAARDTAGDGALAEALQRSRLVPAHRRTAEAWRGLDGAPAG